MYVLLVDMLPFRLLWNTIRQVSNFPFSAVSFPSPAPILITSAFDTDRFEKQQLCTQWELDRISWTWEKYQL